MALNKQTKTPDYRIHEISYVLEICTVRYGEYTFIDAALLRQCREN